MAENPVDSIIRIGFGLVGIACSVGALFLLQPDLTGLPPDRYALVSDYLLFLSLLFSLAALLRRPDETTSLMRQLWFWFGRMILVVMGGAALVVGLDALVQQPPLPMVALLLIPGCGSLLVLAQIQARNAFSRQTEVDGPPFTFARAVRLALVYGLRVLAMMAMVAVGVFTYRALGDVLLRGAQISSSAFLASLPASVFGAFSQMIVGGWPTLLIMVGAVLVLLLIIAAATRDSRA